MKDKSSGLVLHPYHGVYGIESKEDLDAALLYIGITEYSGSRMEFGNWDDSAPCSWLTEELDVVDYTGDPIQGAYPYLVHYYFLLPWRADGFSRMDVDRHSRLCKGYIRFGFSPVHTYKCITLDLAKEIYESRDV